MVKEVKDEIIQVDYEEFNNKYNARDINARRKMRELIESVKINLLKYSVI